MSDILPEERGISDVASSKAAWFTPKRKAVAMAVVTIVVLAIIFWRNSKKQVEEVAPTPPHGIGQIVRYEAPPEPPPLPRESPKQNFAAQPPTPPALFPPPQQTLPPPQAFAPPAVVQKPKVHRLLSFETSDPKPGAANAGGANAGAPGTEAGTRVTYKPTAISGAQAGPAIDKTLVLMPGLIRCILDIAVDSQMPGPLVCHLPDPVISDGNVVLMEAGSKIIGSYSSDVKQGQDRIMAVSATGYTPNGVPVPLGGPIGDPLGRTGMPGSVDNHYLERFGAGVLLTFLDGALGITQAAVSKGGNSYVSLQTGSGAGGLAEQVLRSTINIPPTITKNQGDEVYIWILQPIDFSPAYKLINK
jgi:type IV secretion system protein VirB10